MNKSGLSATAAASIWNDMNDWRQHPSNNLNGEAKAAFGTKVLMAEPAVKTYLMNIFKDSSPGGRFETVSLTLMKSSYNQVKDQVDQRNSVAPTLVDSTANPAWAARQRAIELELAMRTARVHNGDYNRSAREGSFAAVLAEDSAARGRQYAHRFVNAAEQPVVQPADPNRRQPTADYFSLRCTASLSSTKVPRGGLQMTALQLY